MQCEFCTYEFSMREIQEGKPCPKCEAKKLEHDHGLLGDGGNVAPHVKKVMGEYRGAQPVVVMDLNMSFNSMVWFMVKAAIASIPALVILFVIGFVLTIFLSGLIGNLIKA
jgi:hypothetical protein